MRHVIYWTVLATGTALSLYAYGKRIEHNYRTRIGT